MPKIIEARYVLYEQGTLCWMKCVHVSGEIIQDWYQSRITKPLRVYGDLRQAFEFTLPNLYYHVGKNIALGPPPESLFDYVYIKYSHVPPNICPDDDAEIWYMAVIKSENHLSGVSTKYA